MTLLDRRRFLLTTSLASAAGVAALRASPADARPPEGSGSGSGSGSGAAGPAPEPKGAYERWESVRALFALDPAYAHLGLFFLASHPTPVRRAIEDYRKRLDADPLRTVESSMFDFEHPERNLAVRAAGALGHYLGVSGDDIALTGNTTMGLSLLYHGLPLKAGDEVLTTEHDHFVHYEAIRLATERCGATWRRIPLFDASDQISADDVAARVKRAIGPSTRVLGVTWVHSSTGVKLPIRRIADVVGEVNAGRAAKDRVLLLVDGVHGIGVEDPNLAALGCDALAAGAHKWLFAPRGTGFVWAKPEVWASMRPLFPSFTAFDLMGSWFANKPPPSTPRASWFSPGGFHAYEHYWATPVAIELHTQIGPARITQRIHALNEQAKEGLAKMQHVVLYTPRSADLSAGLVCFDVKGKKPQEVVDLLAAQKILGSTTPYRTSYARLAFGIVNTEAEVERALRAIRAMG
jgi:selenocysteine lyase/cysteine desulfurase